MRFRRSGTNWEGRKWRTTPALNALLDLIENQWPDGNSNLDGTVASKGHDQNNPTSDHRPSPYTDTQNAVVRAVDAWFATKNDGDLFGEYLRELEDPRIRYVIWQARIFTSYPLIGKPAYQWRPYSGVNPHTKHMHVSVDRAHDNDVRPFPPILTPREDNMLPLQLGDGTGDRAHKIEDVRYLQSLLNEAGATLNLDGVYGPATAVAVAAFTMPTGNPAGQRGEWLGGRQLANLTKRLVATPPKGVTVDDVKAIINDSQIVAP